MGKSAILAVRIIADAQGAVKGLDDTASAAERFRGGVDRAAVGAGIALGAISAAALDCEKSASDLQQSAGAVDSVFGAQAASIHKFGDEAAKSLGLSSAEAQQMAAVLGSQLKNMGIPMDEVGQKTQDLEKLGADLAATYGGTTSQAVEALSSLLRGERDPIERYGVSIKQADIAAWEAAHGMKNLTADQQRNADMQATLALLTQQTGAAQGQFAREANSAEGAQQRQNAAIENAKAKIGAGLLPIFAQWSTAVADIATKLGDNVGVVTAVVAVVAVLAGVIIALSTAMKIYTAIQAIATAMKLAENAAWLASPITWIVLAIVVAVGLVVAAIIWCINHQKELGRIMSAIWAEIMREVNMAIKPFVDIYNWIVRVINAIGRMDFGALGRLIGINLTANTTPAAAAAAAVAPPNPSPRSFTMATVTPSLSAAAAAATAGGSASDRGAVYVTNVDVTVEGALDPIAVGEQVEKVLKKYRTTSGHEYAGGM